VFAVFTPNLYISPVAAGGGGEGVNAVADPGFAKWGGGRTIAKRVCQRGPGARDGVKPPGAESLLYIFIQKVAKS